MQRERYVDLSIYWQELNQKVVCLKRMNNTHIYIHIYTCIHIYIHVYPAYLTWYVLEGERVASKKIVYFQATGFIKTLIETGESNETEMILKEKKSLIKHDCFCSKGTVNKFNRMVY